MNILDINITRYGAGGNGKTQTMTLSQPATESVSQLLARGVGDAGRFVEDSWKRDNLMAYGDRGVIAVSVPFSDLKTWLSIQKRIENIAIIEHVDVILLSRDEARLNLHFMGSSRQLELAMEQTSLKLRQNEGVWYINPTQ